MTDTDPARTHIASLDGVRGIAILLVLIVHCYFRGPDSGLSYLGSQLAILGWTGVDLFFVLSGFLITSILIRTKNDPDYFRSFYVKRVGRIFPLYFLLQAGNIPLLFAPIPKVAAFARNYADHWWAYVLFLPNLGEIFGWELRNFFGPTWSLAVEEQYYLVWPFAVWLLDARQLKIVAPCLLIALAGLRWLLAGHVDPELIYHFTLTHADGILIGSIIALYRDEIFRRVALVRMATALLACALVGLFLIAGETHNRNLLVMRYGFLLISLFYGCFVVLAIDGRRLAAMLSVRPLRLVGKYSYAMYLIHWPFLLVLDHVPLPGGPFAWWAFVIAFTAAVTAAAAVSWALIEKPAATAIRRHFLKPRRTADIPQESPKSVEV